MICNWKIENREAIQFDGEYNIHFSKAIDTQNS